MLEPTIFELSAPGARANSCRHAATCRSCRSTSSTAGTPLRDDRSLPEVSELDVVRHFTRLSQRNYAIDTPVSTRSARAR